MNEPHTVAVQGYDTGIFAPGRCSILLGRIRCNGGNSDTEPYIVGHHLLLAHATAVNIYRNKYQVHFSVLIHKPHDTYIQFKVVFESIIKLSENRHHNTFSQKYSSLLI